MRNENKEQLDRIEGKLDFLINMIPPVTVSVINPKEPVCCCWQKKQFTGGLICPKCD